MSETTTVRLADVPDFFEDKYPGKMRFLAGPLGTEQIAFTHRELPPGAGGKGGYGHRHRTQEEVYFVVKGRLEFKLGDEVTDVRAGTAVRVSPSLWRSVHNSSGEDADLIIVSVKDFPGDEDHELLEDFWPEGA